MFSLSTMLRVLGSYHTPITLTLKNIAAEREGWWDAEVLAGLRFIPNLEYLEMRDYFRRLSLAEAIGR